MGKYSNLAEETIQLAQKTNKYILDAVDSHNEANIMDSVEKYSLFLTTLFDTITRCSDHFNCIKDKKERIKYLQEELFPVSECPVDFTHSFIKSMVIALKFNFVNNPENRKKLINVILTGREWLLFDAGYSRITSRNRKMLDKSILEIDPTIKLRKR